MIALIDYGAGNLTSVRKALAEVGADVYVPASPEAIARARAVIVPGVGHFQSTSPLDARWRDAIRAAVNEGRPLLGVCVGMQWLFEGSEEAPGCAGLGLLPGVCVRLTGRDGSGDAPAVKVPHVGWNSLRPAPRDSKLLGGLASGVQVYFTHSYAAPVTADTIAVTEHGERFAAAVERDLVWGVQFHPEKSSDAGLRILRNFLALMR